MDLSVNVKDGLGKTKGIPVRPGTSARMCVSSGVVEMIVDTVS